MPTTHEPDAAATAGIPLPFDASGAGRPVMETAARTPCVDAPRHAAGRSDAAPVGLSRAAHDMMIRLPAGMLRHCGERFPYILERIAADWADPARLQATIDALIYDARGGRSGFPFEVLAELAELRRCHERWVGPRGRAGR